MRRVPEDRFLPDQLFYITLSTLDRQQIFGDSAAAKAILETMKFYRLHGAIEVYAYVVMPDHIHLMIRPLFPLSLPQWVRRFKSYTTHILGGKPFWLSGYWSEVIVSPRFYHQKIGYIHDNPVRAGLSETQEGYLWSSAREYYEGVFDVVTSP